jgi:hypothetical protein
MMFRVANTTNKKRTNPNKHNPQIQNQTTTNNPNQPPPKKTPKHPKKPQNTKALSEPLYFVDFLREPVVDDATGEVLVARPSHYEAVPGGLAEVRERAEALQVTLRCAVLCCAVCRAVLHVLRAACAVM